MLDIGKVHEVNCWLCAILGIFVNSLLIWLIVYRSVAEIRPYSRILLQTCVIDIYTIITMIVLQPVFVIVSGWNVMYVNGPARYSALPYNFILMLLWMFGFYFSIISNALQFFYRYLVLCREVKISSLRYLLMLLTASIPVFGYLWIVCCVTYPDPSSRISSFTAQISFNINETNQIVQIAYGAILPCVSSLLSIIAVLTSVLVVNASSVNYMAYITMPVHWIPVLNPVITIIVVRSYRRAVFRRFNKFRVSHLQIGGTA
ncbi:serpentine type 7TM GPCR chemoreceptor str domain-containing protein [Ditylenchus destructor]|uniref:Serpentine type 7TM GPCR chemoreceptor str domain-containing protein n=1 Tax=Ditylenchus destructor TaxID=166010 RepID=A0AAD4MUC7_9BILA|nr:serpentine type 7TM GPCR chemoreceptor str domain-containing protein [Ditylenchus destructor]